VFFILFVFFLSIYAAIAFYVTTPKPSQPFMAFGVCSHNLSPVPPCSNSESVGSSSTVTLNQTINWTLNITNNRDAIQFVKVISRIGNNQTSAPNATRPAALPVLTNSTLFVPRGNTVTDFRWRVLSVISNSSLDYLRLDINGMVVNSTAGTPPENQFRLLLELWTFDNVSGLFVYYTWLQVWFSVRA